MGVQSWKTTFWEDKQLEYLTLAVKIFSQDPLPQISSDFSPQAFHPRGFPPRCTGHGWQSSWSDSWLAGACSQHCSGVKMKKQDEMCPREALLMQRKWCLFQIHDPEFELSEMETEEIFPTPPLCWVDFQICQPPLHLIYHCFNDCIKAATWQQVEPCSLPDQLSAPCEMSK